MKFFTYILLSIFLFSACGRIDQSQDFQRDYSNTTEFQDLAAQQVALERGWQELEKERAEFEKQKQEFFAQSSQKASQQKPGFDFVPPRFEPAPESKYLYTYEDLKIGAIVGPWKINKLEAAMTWKPEVPISKENFQVTFDREVSLTGTYVYYPEDFPFQGLQVCFYPNEAGLSELPGFQDTKSWDYFCFSNRDTVIKALDLKPEQFGQASVVINSYSFMAAPIDGGGPAATFLKLK